MSWLTGPLVASALLLVTSGALKLVRPHAMAAALSGLGTGRAAKGAAYAIGAAELLIGVWLLVAGGAWACAAVAAAYAGFTAFLVAGLLAPERVTTCGCTGTPDTPPTWAHAAMTGGFAVLAGWAAMSGGITTPVDMFLVTDPLAAVTVLGYAVVVAILGWAVMSLLPRVAASAPSGNR